MVRRKLGEELEVSALSLGAMGYGKARELPDRAEMIDLIRTASGRGHHRLHPCSSDKRPWWRSAISSLMPKE